MEQVSNREKYGIAIHKHTVPAVFDNMVLFLLALCPILQHYKGYVTNPSMEICVFVSIYMVFKMARKDSIYIVPVLFLMFYAFFVSYIHGFSFSPFLREMLQIILYLAVINQCLNVKKVMRICTGVALLATVLVTVQYACYYLAGFHLKLVPTAFLAESSGQWLGLIRTGLIGVSGRRMTLYRPSAFFLEPSHFAIFCIPVVLVCLLSRDSTKKQIKKAAIISLGIVLSTSGIGIMAVGFIWALYGIFYHNNKRKNKEFKILDLLKPHSLMFMIAFAIVFLILFFSVRTFRESVSRIFTVADGNVVTAFDGRTNTGRKALQMLSGVRILIGYGNEISVNNWNMAGFYLTFFLHGLLGTLLFYLFYVRSLFKVKADSFWVCLMFIGLSFFTVHTFAAYYKMYYTFIILSGYMMKAKDNYAAADHDLGKYTATTCNEGTRI